MSTTTDPSFDREYLLTWTEPDQERRHERIDALWAADGRLILSPLGITVEGVEDIAAHVDRVHEENIAGRGLVFRYDQQLDSGEALLLRWSMVAPNDAVVGRGVDVVFRDADGAVRTVYMFMGVD